MTIAAGTDRKANRRSWAPCRQPVYRLTRMSGSTADDRVEELVAEVSRRLDRPAPHLVGVAGPVAVGKTTVARALAEAMGSMDRRGQVLGTDAFLLPNDVLAERGLTMRKGFPESFDASALERCLSAIRAGELRVEVPVYSHLTYDVVPGEVAVVEDPDVVVVEGVNALQDPAAELLDVAVYVDAPTDVVRGWFVERLVGLVEAARDDPSSFYHGFASAPAEEVRAFAERAWDGINAVNLHEHILPTREAAHVVVEKGPGHEIVAVRAR